MSRRQLREQVFRLLFRIEFNPVEDMDEQCRLFLEETETEISPEDGEYIVERYTAIRDNLTEIDAKINERTKGWTTGRMGKVDLTIIRLALYEMLYDEAIPEGVAINEAVELAKKFGQDESAGFVNGVLARFTSGKA